MMIKESTCVVCGKSFHAPHGGQYCSQNCQKKAYRERVKTMPTNSQRIVREVEIDALTQPKPITISSNIHSISSLGIGLSGISPTGNAETDINLSLYKLSSDKKDLEYELRSLQEKYEAEGRLLLKAQEEAEKARGLQDKIDSLKKEIERLEEKNKELDEYHEATSTKLGQFSQIGAVMLGGITDQLIAKYAPKMLGGLLGVPQAAPQQEQQEKVNVQPCADDDNEIIVNPYEQV